MSAAHFRGIWGKDPAEPCCRLGWTRLSDTGGASTHIAFIAFRGSEHVGTRIAQVFAAQWLACALPCRRFVGIRTGADARLGADVDRYSLIVADLRPPLPAGFTGAPKSKQIQDLRSAGVLAGPSAYDAALLVMGAKPHLCS